MHASSIGKLLRHVYDTPLPAMADLVRLLGCEGDDMTELLDFADNVRREFMGDGVLLRGLVEFSNHCRNTCAYCGLTADNVAIRRYRLTRDEIIAAVAEMASYGIRTVVLQSGEDDGLDPAWLAELITVIKERFALAVTLSVGERPVADYRLWRSAGADRYLLKIETTDHRLYASMHRLRKLATRFACLEMLKDLGYQTGSGIMVGLKGQTLEGIARDIIFFKQAEFDMIGIGPFIPHADTRLGGAVSGDVGLTLKAIALTRIVMKNTHMPATTALGSIGADYRVDGLKAGANVLMPNFTPAPYRALYEIYPGKRCVSERAASCAGCMEKMVAGIGRQIERSRGDSLKQREVSRV